MVAFLSGTLMPHIDAAERTLYPELERMFQNQHSMAPMRREHDEIRKPRGGPRRACAASWARPRDDRPDVARAPGHVQLYALLKIHLAEEERYLRIVDHGVTTDVADLMAAAMEHPVGIG